MAALNQYLRIDGAWAQLGPISPVLPGPGPDPDPDPDPLPEPPASWQAAVDSRSFAQVEAWYAANAGYQAIGVTPTAGSLSSSSAGQVIENRSGGSARWAHNNVTYRGCLINWSSALYGAYGNPTFGNPFVGVTFEYCTFVGPSSATEARRAAVISATNANAVTFRYCQFYGGTSGVANDSAAGGAIIEYCWVHDLATAAAAHRTSLRTTAGGGRFFRNYCTDGGSSCISIYFDKNPIANFDVAENILNGSSPNASPSYLITMKEGEHVATATNVRIINNYLGPQYQFGLINGVSGFSGVRGNVISGNRHFLTGASI